MCVGLIMAEITPDYYNTDQAFTFYPWDGSLKDVRKYGSVSVFCTVAPSSAYAIQVSPDKSTWKDVSFIDQSLSIGTSITSTGKYDISGGVFIKLSGGSGGTFMLGGSQ